MIMSVASRLWPTRPGASPFTGGVPADPGPAPRLVATDLDGTLLGSDGDVSARTREVLRRVEQAGVPFVMVTGRPPRWMSMVSEQTGHRGLAVCANGALVYDLHREEVVRSSLLDAAAASEVAQALRAELPELGFAVERTDGTFGHENAYLPSFEHPGAQVQALAELLSGDSVKLLARHPTMNPDELLAAATRTVGDGVTLTHSSSEGLLEISAAGITKATGLASLADDLGIEAAHVIAFGDMPNDLPMLAWAGRSVAVANAHPDVVAAADEVTGSNDEHGVAQVLKRWF